MLNLEVVGQPHTTNCVDRMTESQMEREQREARIREELEAEEEDEDLYVLLRTARVFTMLYNLWFLSLSFIYPTNVLFTLVKDVKYIILYIMFICLLSVL